MTSECWLWTGAISTQGYGKIDNGKLVMYAHRYAWTLANGPIPEGFQIHHICRKRLCVRPSHLEAIPAIEHARLPRSNFEVVQEFLAKESGLFDMEK